MTTESHTIRVLAERLTEAREALEKLAKKARRYGCPDIAVTVGERATEDRWVKDWDGEERAIRVEVVELIVSGDAPRVGNHEFLARIELVEGGNLVDTRPGVTDLDKRFQHTDGYCAHCRTTRRRNEVFVVRDLDTGDQLQVGRDCLRDFLGIDNPTAVAHRFAFFRAVREFEEDVCRGSKADWAQSLEGLLSLSAVCIRLFGWCSKGQAAHDPNVMPTSGYVWMVLEPPFRATDAERALIKRILDERTEADYETARATIRWVREELKGDGDYEHNLRVLFTADNVRDAKRLGLVVSAVAGYHRAKELELRRTKEREAAAASAHVGTVGARLRDLRVTLQLQRVIGGNEWADSVLIKFVDDQGNILTWITSKGSGLEVGEQALLTGTVKAHGEFNGVAETKLTRCALKAVA